MKKIKLNLILEKINFDSPNFETDKELLKEYEFYVDANSDFLDDLYTETIQEKGDWINMDYTDSLELCYVDLNLTFHSLELSEDNVTTLNNTVNVIEQLIKIKEVKEVNNNIDRFNLYEEIFSNDGIVISISQEGGTLDLYKNDIESFFKESNIEYKEISRNLSLVDQGASSGVDTILYFIVNTMSSGITYDFIKFGISKTCKGFMDYTISKKIENLKFKELRKTIEERCRVDSKNLVLKEMNKNNNEIYFVFIENNSEIHIITNQNYEIINLNYEIKNELTK